LERVFAVFGRDRRTVSAFEVAVRNLEGNPTSSTSCGGGTLLVEHKSFATR
jgi:hypothetical protein